MDSDADTTGEEDVFSKVTVAYISVVNVCHNSVAFFALSCQSVNNNNNIRISHSDH